MRDEIRIVIADDHPIVRRGLRESIEEAEGLTVVAEAGDGKSALELIRSQRPEVAILDISMPVKDGLAIAREVMGERLGTAVIFLTMHGEESVFDEAMRLGVKGYVLKESSMGEIVNCIRAVAEGKHYTSPALTSYLVGRNHRAAAQQAGLKDLTPTERRVLQLIAEYKTSREIAEQLFISYNTVETHRRNICDKLGLRGSHALMRFALAHQPDLD